MGTGVFLHGKWTLSVLLPDDKPATRTKIRNLLSAASQALFEITGGQMCFGEVYLSVHPYGMPGADLRFDADLGVSHEKNSKTAASSDIGGVGRPWLSSSLPLASNVINDPEQCNSSMPGWCDPEQQTPLERDVARLLHEFGHYAFGLDDEYDNGGTCPCLMSCLGVLSYCDTNHKLTKNHPKSCWEIISERYGLIRPSDPKFQTNPGTCADIVWHDVSSTSRVVIATHQHSCNLSRQAAHATSDAWKLIAGDHEIEVFHPKPTTSDALFAISNGLVWLGDPRGFSSAGVLLIGNPDSKERDVQSELVQLLVRGRGAMANVVSPEPVHAKLREFAVDSSGVAEVVTHKGSRAEVDIRTRSIARLGCSMDGWGVNCKHRTLRPSKAAPVSFGIHVEPRVQRAAFVLVRPADEARIKLKPNRGEPDMQVQDPSGNTHKIETSEDGTILVCAVDHPPPGVWSLTVSGGVGIGDDAVPISILGLVDNHDVWIRTLQPSVVDGIVELTASVSDEVKRAKNRMVTSFAPPAPVQASPDDHETRRWCDAPSTERTFNLIASKQEVWHTGYQDFRLDFVYAEGKEAPIRRVLPYQLFINRHELPSKRALSSPTLHEPAAKPAVKPKDKEAAEGAADA